MCRVTPTPPALYRKRSSSSYSTAGESSSDDSSASSSKKRVSFHNIVTVYPFERLGNEQVGDVFYTPEDYRRFRSDICLETLEQRAAESSTYERFGLVMKRLVSSLLAGQQSGQRRTSKKRDWKALPAHHYPWMVDYHPHDDDSETQPQESASQPMLSSSSSVEDQEKTREQALIQELAFACF